MKSTKNKKKSTYFPQKKKKKTKYLQKKKKKKTFRTEQDIRIKLKISFY